MKTIAIGFAALTWTLNAVALTDSEICSFRGQMVQSLAQARDEGKSEKQTEREVKAVMRKVFPKIKPPDFQTYIRLVYDNRDIRPDQLRTVTEFTCIRNGP